MSKERCSNMNHGRSGVTVRFCPSCGEVVNNALKKTCDETKHAIRRKDRHMFCVDCGKKLR